RARQDRRVLRKVAADRAGLCGGRRERGGREGGGGDEGLLVHVVAPWLRRWVMRLQLRATRAVAGQGQGRPPAGALASSSARASASRKPIGSISGKRRRAS